MVEHVCTGTQWCDNFSAGPFKHAKNGSVREVHRADAVENVREGSPLKME